MKKSCFVTLSLIFILNNNALYGMMANKARRSFSYKTVQQPKTFNYTNPHRKPILIDRVKQYYNQMKQGFSQWWHGTNYPQVTLNETTVLLNNISTKKPAAMKDFNTFLETKDQDSINQLLNKLIFSQHEIDFLDAKVIELFFGLALNNRNYKKIAAKVIHWAQENIIQLFNQNITITNDSFLITLLQIDYDLDKELIAVIHDNLDYIQQQPTGAQFLTLLQKQHQKIYDAIMQRKQTVKGILKEGVQKSLEELRTRE